MENSNNYVLIMAGGVGSRFWPKSRNSFPKQFVDILGTGKSLLQYTFERFEKICLNDNIFILTNSQYKDLVQEQLPNIPVDNILLEPSRNNTAPCLAYASYKIMKINPEASIVVAPSDHLILKEEYFLDKIKKALEFSKTNDSIITLGITPTRADTGYGYIKFNESNSQVCKVESFLEKPSFQKAQEYIQSGSYLWNAGIFIWSVKTIHEAFKKHSLEIHNLFINGMNFYNTIDEVKFINSEYPKSPNISIDYAILEKANNIYTIPADIGWSDLGTWASLHETLDKDENSNSSTSDSVEFIETENCLVDIEEGKVAVINGLQDYIIVSEKDVLLICPKSKEQEVKNIASKVVLKYGIKYE
jgi:mannose-1-phosphate guanylyltransferase